MGIAILFFFLLSQLSTIPTITNAKITFHHYTMDIIWPMTFCYVNDYICVDPNIKLEFFVHGLWPSHEDGSDVNWSICPGNRIPFPKEKAVSWGFTEKLRRFWPNLLGNDFDLWETEWYGHGICSTLKPKDYFKFTYDLCVNLNFPMLEKNLHTKGIVPAKQPYSRNYMYQSFKEIMGKNVTLKCVSKQQSYYLYGVRVCFDPKQKLLIPIDCPQDFIACGESDRDIPVFLPDNKL